MHGVEYVGWRRTTVSSKFSAESERAMRTFINAARPVGPGGVDFLSVNGQPVLTDINTGRFNGAHAPKLFHAMHAPPGSEFYCFKIEPPKAMSVKVIGYGCSLHLFNLI
jgi:hypothetical protein